MEEDENIAITMFMTICVCIYVYKFTFGYIHCIVYHTLLELYSKIKKGTINYVV